MCGLLTVNLHLLLQVTGELLDDLESWEALRAALPVGTVSGAPKVFITKSLFVVSDLSKLVKADHNCYGGNISY